MTTAALKPPAPEVPAPRPRARLAAPEIALLAISAASALPRIAHLTSSLWNDETFATHLRLGFNAGSFAWMAYDTHPPLYSLLMLFWISVFGDGALSIRLFPLICSVASVFLIGKLAASIHGRAVGLLAAAMLALSGASVFYAQEARSYSFVLTVFLLMAWFLARYGQAGQARDLGGFFVCALVCSVSHVYALLFVICLFALLAGIVPGPRARNGVLRLALADLALAAPFYFLIALMILFTDEHTYLWRGLTYRFGGREAAALISFSLFGHGGLNRFPMVHLAATALFLTGIVATWRGRKAASLRPEKPASDFRLATTPALFAAAVCLGLLLSLAAVSAPGWLSGEALGRLVGPDKHPELMAAMPGLLRRTGVLYLVGYSGLGALWLASSRRGRRGGSLELPDGLGLGVGGAGRVVAGFPVLAIGLVLLISRFRPTYNNRYMTALVPFIVITIAVALGKLTPSARALAFVAGSVLAAQAYSLTGQEEAYALLKPDYRDALRYWNGVDRGRHPLTGTALWELENLNRYYAERGEIGPLRIVTRSEALGEKRVGVIVPRAYPLEGAHLSALRDFVRSGTIRAVRFPGLAVYEVGGGAADAGFEATAR